MLALHHICLVFLRLEYYLIRVKMSDVIVALLRLEMRVDQGWAWRNLFEDLRLVVPDHRVQRLVVGIPHLLRLRTPRKLGNLIFNRHVGRWNNKGLACRTRVGNLYFLRLGWRGHVLKEFSNDLFGLSSLLGLLILL